MVDQEKIHKQCLSNDSGERIRVLEQLEDSFSLMPDKKQAWNDLISLVNDEYSDVRELAADTIGLIFSQVPDKQLAWNELIKLTSDEDSAVRATAVFALSSAFSTMLNKQQAWNDLLKLTNNENSNVRELTANALVSAFSQVPNKQQTWNDLHRLISNENNWVRCKVASILASAFFSAPDKQQAWSDLHRLTNDEDSLVRYHAVEALGSAFSQVPDKLQAWNDLHRLANDDIWVKPNATSVLGSVYSQLPDKQQAWNDLYRLINDECNEVRSSAASAIGFAFSQLPDKQQAWNNLHRLTNDKDGVVRNGVAFALGYAFYQLPDKQQAWNDLLRLINDKDGLARSGAAHAFGSAFSQLPDKQQAWNNLHRLTYDKDRVVRSRVSFALGSAFSHLPDKQQAVTDLHRLVKDEDCYVRTSANHSLGKISIFKASHAEIEENYKEELEKAVEFFKVAAEESPHRKFNPSQFCLPFYRSFYTIVFKNKDEKEEVDKYLEEAKAAIEGSEKKELLFEAVENLAKALEAVQSIEDLDLEAKKVELNFYRQYCDRAAELMIDSEEAAPYTTGILRRGLPILDRSIKGLLEEIQSKAKIACKESKGTDAEEIVCEIDKQIQNVISDSQKQYIEILEDIVSIIKITTPPIPENRFIFNKIEAIENKEISPEKYHDLPLIVSITTKMKVVSDQTLDKKLDQRLQKFDLIFNEIIYIRDKLSCISFDISKIKLNSADVLADLKTMKEELEKLSEAENLNTFSIEKLDSTQSEKLNGLNNDIIERLDEIKILICELSKDNDELYQEYSRRLDKLKQSKLDTLLQRYSAAISLISFAISGIQIAR